MSAQQAKKAAPVASVPAERPAGQVGERRLAARLEPFDSYWQAPVDVEKGYGKFAAYYRANYLRHLPADKAARILVVSCGPGYLVKLLRDEGYADVLGIDSDPLKIAHAERHGLPCATAEAFAFLERNRDPFDVIVPEQELNHLTLDEQIEFLRLCRRNLKPGGIMIVYGLNGANPLVGSENLAHNIDHFNTFTDYSLKQIIRLGGLEVVEVMPLKLYVFWKNPLNYVGLVATTLLELFFRACFILYGKEVKILTKKLAAVCRNPA
ncbi:methyltransferase domain-containing protein [Benzoatithermus flavus]|uniref:Class I SAM-dependent methyltransferase n=1 Tax=Benzoatithermus flavus TaxID=3108223 RepID=A0ABU8XUE0_9PROT